MDKEKNKAHNSGTSYDMLYTFVQDYYHSLNYIVLNYELLSTIVTKDCYSINGNQYTILAGKNNIQW